MRGTQQQYRADDLREGITPAHAGNTDAATFAEIIHEDHPRACGEHEAVEDVFSKTRGSPPRMRGTRGDIPEANRAERITPAHAGNTDEETEAAS